MKKREYILGITRLREKIEQKKSDWDFFLRLGIFLTTHSTIGYLMKNSDLSHVLESEEKDNVE